MADALDKFESYYRKLWENPEQFLYINAVFATLAPFETNSLKRPKGPGGYSYSSERATARRIMNADPGFPFPYVASDFLDPVEKPEDVPQELINAFRKSFRDGIELFFPDDLMSNYIQETLAAEAFENTYNLDKRLAERIKERFPRLTSMPYQGNHPQGSLRTSIEHELRRSFDPAAASDALECRHDRKHLNIATLYKVYNFYTQNPEVWAAILLIQDAIHAAAMESCIYNGLLFDESGLEGEIEDTCPGYFTMQFTAQNIEMENIPLFFGAAILAFAEKQKGTEVDRIEPSDIINGIKEAERAGIFVNKFSSQYGHRTVICPFGSTATRWFTMDTGTEDKPEESLLVKALRKVYDEIDNNNEKLQAICDSVSKTMTSILAETEPHIQKRLDQAPRTTPTPNIPQGCPFHAAAE